MPSPVIALRRAQRFSPMRSFLRCSAARTSMTRRRPARRRRADQIVTLTIWSSERGTREALEIADRVVALLDEAALTLAGHRLVDLRFIQMATRREQNGRLARADLRFRATTEQN